MYTYHAGVVTTHPYSSPWWQWPAMVRPVYFYQLKTPAEGMWGAIASFGNPMVWWTGFICMLTTVVLAWNKKDKRVVFIYVAGSVLYCHVVAGWASQVLIFTTFSSIQLFMIGIMSEYISRIYNQVQDRPLYIVQEATFEKKNDD